MCTTALSRPKQNNMDVNMIAKTIVTQGFSVNLPKSTQGCPRRRPHRHQTCPVPQSNFSTQFDAFARVASETHAESEDFGSPALASAPAFRSAPGTTNATRTANATQSKEFSKTKPTTGTSRSAPTRGNRNSTTAAVSAAAANDQAGIVLLPAAASRARQRLAPATRNDGSTR